MENRIEENEFYVVKSKNLAMGLKWMGFKCYTYDSNEYEDRKVYSFKNTKDLKLAISFMRTTRIANLTQ